MSLTPYQESWMRREILEQPEALRRLLAAELPAAAALAEAAKARGVRLLYVAARGTSDHAAIYAKYLIETLAGIPVALAAPSVFTLYGAQPDLRDALVLGISQSGKAADANTVLTRARQAGCLTACITNDASSPMATAVEFPLICRAGEERSLPATKTYTTSLALAYALSTSLAGRSDLRQELLDVPMRVEQALAAEPEIAARAERYRYMTECVVLARGIHFCTALELSLKLSETSYLRAHPYSAADFQHGPIAVVDEDFPCVVIAPRGVAHAGMSELVQTLAEREAELVILSDDPELLARATTPLPIPEAPEFLSPISTIVAGQLFAYHLARIKGRDPDHPRGLRKVTHTL